MTGEQQSEVYRQQAYRWRDAYEKLREENTRLKSELDAIRKYVEGQLSLNKFGTDSRHAYKSILARLLNEHT